MHGMRRVTVVKAFAWLLPFILTFFIAAEMTEGTVSLYGVGEYSLYPALTSLASAYSYHKDTVTVTYAGTASLAIVTLAFDVSYSVFGAFDSQVSMSYLEPNTLQLPLFGSGIAFVYNLSSYSPDVPLVFDGDTLGKIWSGNITMWNDQALVDLNPNATLPDQQIVLCYSNSTTESITLNFMLGLRQLSSDFDAALTAADGDLSLLPPMLGSQAIYVSTNSTGRINCTHATPYSLTYSDWASSFKYTKANMMNRAGYEVAISVTSIQAAMADFQGELLSGTGDLLVPLIDGAGNSSYPFTYVATVMIEAEGNSTDCSVSQELAQYLSWVQTNQHVSDRMTLLGWSPLTVAYKKKIIDVLGTIRCDNASVLTTAYLIGAGTSRPALTDLAGLYTSSSVTQKYFTTDMGTAIADVKQGAVDYADVTTGVTAAQLSGTQQANMDLVPILGYAAFPAYNIPEIRYNALALNLTLEIWAGIYLSEITNWADPRILAINPRFVGILTNQTINVVLGTDASPLTRMVTTVLSAVSTEFNDTVGIADTPNYPVRYAVNTVLLAGAESVLAARMNSQSYSFAALSSGQLTTDKNVRMAALYNSGNGRFVVPSTASILSAMQDHANATLLHLFKGARDSPSEESYPLVMYDIFLLPKNSTDCTKAAALSDWIYWTQSSSDGFEIASRDGVVLTSTIPVWNKMMLTAITSMTCAGKKVSSIAGCVSAGELCSDNGVCVSNVCECNDGWKGAFCQVTASSTGSSSDSTVLAATLGAIIPAVFLVVILLVVVALVLVVLARRKQRKDEWEIDPNELEMAETLGTGGYGEVFRAKWRGTEVAVKMMAARDNLLTKDMQRNFAEEVRVMTALRHPNVVLFMAACTRPPKMCIVMEFMGLGSLYELLHNELIPELPMALKVKMAYQAAKGMHFLHSSGIVHRDLKSLNLLLDNKWNVKVSDFGLTKFKEDSKNTGIGHTALQGSIHWTAPEVLNENPGVDLILADVYSFGVILWELLTREQPFAGMSPAAVAVAVIRDNLRPHLPDDGDMPETSPEYVELLTSCWHADPTIRPTFLEIMTRLSSLIGDSSSTHYSKTTSSSSSSGTGGAGSADKKTGSTTGPESSWSLPTATSSSSGGESHNSRYSGKIGLAGPGGLRAPEGEVTIVFSDITRAASLWEFNPAAMKDATVMHNQALRDLLKLHSGYEVVFQRDRNSGEGSFCLAFQRTEDALAWCMDAQQTLNKLEWPEVLLEHPGAAEEWGDTDDRVLFRGLRVRMGVHVGIPKVVRDPMTRRVEYVGAVVNTAARITALTHGGQVLISYHAFQRVAQTELAQEKNRIACLGKFEMLDSEPEGAKLYELKSRGLEGRFFGGVSKEDGLVKKQGRSKGRGKDKGANIERSGSQRTGLDASFASSAGGSSSDGDDVQQTVVGEGMMFKEDNFLTSANLCRWVLDFNEIALGKQIGLGSYGMVYKGKWKGVEVAVKRFIKQKLDERHMLDFRAEMAFLSELHHPNIVLFIGACVKRPNLCIVTEFAKQGALKEILLNNSVKLTWLQKMGLLRSAALGINYLHSLHPVIVHRDLKPSNLLVDENWNVKVADFGFARIKEENVTMTRCGTPCWTAPEVVRGEKYSEKADVYSFGVIMWEVLTRKQPYAGRNFMGVSLDVLEGRRPQIPPDTPQDFRKMVKRCWHGTADKRPTMEEVISFLDSILGVDATTDKV